MTIGKPATRLLKEDNASAVWVEQHPGGDERTIKSWVLTPWLACKCLMGIAQPWRHWRGGRRLRQQGLQSPSILSAGVGWRQARPIVRIAMPFVPGVTALERLTVGSQPSDRELARQLGEAVALLAQAGWRHRDFKLSNVVIHRDRDELWLIDPVGVVRDRDPISAMVCMLDRLNVEASDGLVRLPSSLRYVAIRAALESMDSPSRRVVLQKLRTHPQP